MMAIFHNSRALLPPGVIATLILLAAPATAQTILHYDFNETGTTAASQGSNATPVTMRNDAGTATDLHSAEARGVSGQAGDRSFQNTAVSDHGSAANAATNGFRADQADNDPIDGLTSFTISGWFKTDNWSTLSGKTPRLVENHDGSNGFNLQFDTDSDGDLKLEIDSEASESNSGTSGLYGAKNTWVFFAVRYDGTSSSNNVQYYRGFRNDAEAAAAGASSAAVQLVAGNCASCTLDRGPVNPDTAGLVIGNRDELSRPYDGFIDDIRIDSGLTALSTLETYRSGALAPDPITVAYVSTTTVATTVQDQNANTITVNEMSGLSYNPATDRFWAVSDKSGRLLQLDIDFNASGAITAATPVSAVVLASTSDFEGIALGAPGSGGVFVSDELSPPMVREYNLSTGALIQALSIPSVFSSSRSNLRFESLSRRQDNSELLTAVQQALTVDGPAGTSTTIPTVSRMLRFAVSGTSATAAEQYAYVVEPLHATPLEGDGSSLSDIEFLPDGRLIAIERSEGDDETLIRIFDVQRLGATDISQGATAGGLTGQTYTPVGKTLLFSGIFGKLEGIAIGPQLPDGRYVALAVEDNSGSGPNVLHSFVVDIDAGLPEPTNDDRINALDVGQGQYPDSLALATPDGSSSCTQGNGQPDVWFRFTAPTAGLLRVDTCGTHDIGGIDAGTDTVVSLHSADGLTQLGCRDDWDWPGIPACPAAAGSLYDSYIQQAVVQNQQVLIRVSKWGYSPASTILLNVAFDADSDADAVLDGADNCTLVANASQCDSDGDGYGNHCDADLNNNGFTNAQDYILFRAELGQPSTAPTYNQGDLNCNGFVNAQDYVLFRGRLGNPPGPSGPVP